MSPAGPPPSAPKTGAIIWQVILPNGSHAPDRIGHAGPSGWRSVRGSLSFLDLGDPNTMSWGLDDRIRKPPYIWMHRGLWTFPGLADFPGRVFRQSDRGRLNDAFNPKLREKDERACWRSEILRVFTSNHAPRPVTGRWIRCALQVNAGRDSGVAVKAAVWQVDHRMSVHGG